MLLFFSSAEAHKDLRFCKASKGKKNVTIVGFLSRINAKEFPFNIKKKKSNIYMLKKYQEMHMNKKRNPLPRSNGSDSMSHRQLV